MFHLLGRQRQKITVRVQPGQKYESLSKNKKTKTKQKVESKKTEKWLKW